MAYPILSGYWVVIGYPSEQNGPNSGLTALVSRGKWAKFRIGCFGLARKMGQIQDWLLWSREENGPNSGLAALVS